MNPQRPVFGWVVNVVNGRLRCGAWVQPGCFGECRRRNIESGYESANSNHGCGLGGEKTIAASGVQDFGAADEPGIREDSVNV
jgi:hypothetical protein